MTSDQAASDQAASVYDAEHLVSPTVGRFATFAALKSFVSQVVADDRWTDELARRWVALTPHEVVVVRRSRSATFSAAEEQRPVIHIVDGQWDRITVLHELAHLVARDPWSHGPRFCGVELDLVRWWCGIDAWAELSAAFVVNQVVVAAPTRD